jgi:DNA-binding CsgD family transcriptional regulator
MKLGAEDANALLRLIGELHRAATLAEICRHALGRLVPADLHDIVVVGGTVPDEDLYLGTPGGYSATEMRVALRTAYQHPVVAFFHARGDLGPRRISDVTTTERYRDSAFFASQRRLGQVHEIDAMLPGVASHGMAGISVSRSARDFSDRDLAILDHLRGPLGLALSRLLLDKRPGRRHGGRPDDLSPPGLAAVFPSLSRREAEVLFWVAQGKRDRELASILGIRPATATTHVRNLLTKLGVESRLAAAMLAVAARPPHAGRSPIGG